MSLSPVTVVRLNPNDEEVLGVFGRLKSNIHEIKASSNSLRNSVDRSIHSSREFIASSKPVMDTTQENAGNQRGKISRQNSVRSDRPSDLKLRDNYAGVSSKDKQHHKHSSDIVNDSRNGNSDEKDRSSRKEGNRSRVSSYSSRSHRQDGPLKASHAPDEDEQKNSRSKNSYVSESDRSELTYGSLRKDRGESQYGSLRREPKSSRDGRDSRASERSRKSSRSQGLSDQFLKKYHEEWMKHWNIQQMSQSMYAYDGASQLYSPMGNASLLYPSMGQPAGWPPQGLRTVGSTSSLVGMTNISGNLSAPVTPMLNVPPVSITHPPLQVNPGGVPVDVKPVIGQPSISAFKPVIGRASLPAMEVKSIGRRSREEWRGAMLSSTKTLEMMRSGRSTAIFVKDGYPYYNENDPEEVERMERERIEMELFPGMMLFDDTTLRDRVVDFCRHMSTRHMNSDMNDTTDRFTQEMESVFWDLVVHLVGRGENSRSSELAEILARLLQNTGRNSVASVRSEITARGKYSEDRLEVIRQCLLAGDIESAIAHAEGDERNEGYWELTFCLQTAQSNLSCKNIQGNDLAIKMLDQKLPRGDPVHTLCTLTCGKMPNVQACFRNWVSNLAVVLACSSMVSQELRLRFVTALADLLHTANMPMARDICAIFGDPVRRFQMVPFALIGANDDDSATRMTGDGDWSGFFMTEVFVYLAQILKGENLHTYPHLLRLEMSYIQRLMDLGLTTQAQEYCRNIVLVIRSYSVQMENGLYAQLLEILTACVTENVALFQEEWFQWLWKLYEGYGRKAHSTFTEKPDLSPRQTEAPAFPDISQVAQQDSMSSSSYNPETSISEPGVTFYQGPPSETMTSSRRGSTSSELEPVPQFPPTNHPPSRRASEKVDHLPLPQHVPENVVMSDVRPNRTNSVSVSQPESTNEEPPAVPMFYSNATLAPARPAFFGAFPAQGAVASFAPQEPSSPPIESPFNTGNALHFQSIQPATPDTGMSEGEEEKENHKPTQIYDPTREHDELDTIGTRPSAKKHENTNQKQENSGWFSGWFPRAKGSNDGLQAGKNMEIGKKAKEPGWLSTIAKKIKRSQQVHLPDDKVKWVYDDMRKRWVDPTKPVEETEEEAVVPPPKMVFPQPDFTAARPAMGPTPPSGGNMFRIGGAGAGGYNPYATIMAGLQSAPVKPVELTNHFIPAPSIPEE